MEVRDEKMFGTDTQSGTPIEDRVLNQVRSLEKWYSAEFERRLNELATMLQSQLESKVEEVRAQFEGQSKVIPKGPAPVQELSSILVEEIGRSESESQRLAAELERMVADDSVALGKLLQKRSQELELKAYLRGLKFKADAH